LLVALGGCGRIDFGRLSDAAVDVLDASTEVRGPGTWTAIPAGPLPPTVWTRAIWSGRELVVFGGALDPPYNSTNSGARFDPETQIWTPISTTAAPSPRHTAILLPIGDRMFEYGGATQLTPLAGGGLYDLGADTWSAVTAGPVGQRIYSEAHVAGTRILLWGGLAASSAHQQTGFLYDPANDQWAPMSTVGAPAARSWASSVWTGEKLIVWGGCNGSMPPCPNFFGDGAIYDLALDTWTPMSAAGAPSPREAHSAVWTGTEMIVFGGATTMLDGNPVNTGAIYTPATDTWRPITTTGAPGPRCDHAAVWLGTQMLVWGSNTGMSDGYLYDPVADQWSKISSANAPSSRQRFAYATDGRRLFVFGGSYGVATGAVWSPEE
jgi:N-acetylneuraminic acid mutarotase